MANTIDLIKNIIVRIEMNKRSRKNRKIEAQLISELHKKFYSILVQEEDEIFFEDFEKLIASQLTEPYISSNFFPQSISNYAEFRNICGFSGDFKYEIRWLIACILYQKDVIEEFVCQREIYDNLILHNKYEEALDIINTFETKHGVSYWSTECRFFVYSKLGRSVKELVESAPQNVFGSVLNFYELKNRESVTSDEYYYIAVKEIINAKKHLVGAEQAIEFFDYSIAGNAYIAEPEKIMYTIGVIQECSLVDRYLFVTNICNELMNQPKENYLYQCMQSYIGFLRDINDDHLTAIRFVFDTEEHRKKEYALKSRLDNAKCKFIVGELQEARNEAVDLLRLFPNNIQAMSLLVETNILIDDDVKQFEETNLGMLLELLGFVYKLSAQRDDAMESISKLALTCSLSTWSKGILSDIMSRCYQHTEFEYGHHKILCNLQHLDIETILCCLDREECVRYIDEQLDISDEYVRFRKELLCENYSDASKICGIQQIRDYMFVCDKNTTIEEKIGHLHSIDGTNSSIDILSTKIFLASVELEKDSEVVLSIVANLVIDNIYTSLFIPWTKIITFINDGPTELRQNICTPILYYIFAYYIERDKKDDLGIVCSDFFDLEDIQRPSQMKMFADKYEKKMLVYFLKNVCTVKIMDDSVYVFENTQERDQERVEICNVLTFLDPDNEKEYENEIRELTQKLMINKELKIIDESRIHVNVEGIKEQLINAEGSASRFDNNLKNDFQRYMFYQDERVQQWLRILEGEESPRFKETNETSIRLFKELIQKIRNAFVSSGEYGLNGYLSLNVRHNTLDDELRSPLHRAMLYAKKDSANKTYILPECWRQFLNSSDERVLIEAFGAFHLMTENILSKLKNEYIQICTEAKNERGIFDYYLTDADYADVSMYVDNCITFEDFFDKVIMYLWKRTEYNLEMIKHVIRTEIEQDYMNAFNSMRNAISVLSNKTVAREIYQKISEAETDMQNVLEHICHWFQRSNESKHNDFDLQFAFDLGFKTIENMHPEARFRAEKLEETVSDKIPGHFLKSFDGIFYNLFDNIYKKASAQGNIVHIRYALKNVAGKIRIYIENDFDCQKDISEDVRRVEEAKEIYETKKYAEKAKSEGGTGIPKICKIIRYDLGLHPYLDFGYIQGENKFYMEIKF